MYNCALNAQKANRPFVQREREREKSISECVLLFIAQYDARWNSKPYNFFILKHVKFVIVNFPAT